jgi:hypothetical protein
LLHYEWWLHSGAHSLQHLRAYAVGVSAACRCLHARLGAECHTHLAELLQAAQVLQNLQAGETHDSHVVLDVPFSLVTRSFGSSE